MNGVITGGWSYVVAAYSVTTLLLLGYAISLSIRLSGKGESRPESR